MSKVNVDEKMVAETVADLRARDQEIEMRRARLSEEEVALLQKFPITGPVVELNVGGKHFSTRLATLRQVPGSMLDAMFSGRHDLARDAKGRVFIDRPSAPFRWILSVLQTKDVARSGFVVPQGVSPAEREMLLCELDYYGLLPAVNGAIANVEVLMDFARRSPNAVTTWVSSPLHGIREIREREGGWSCGVVKVPSGVTNLDRELQWSVRVLAAGTVTHVFMGVAMAACPHVLTPEDDCNWATYNAQVFGLTGVAYQGTAIASADIPVLPFRVLDTVHFRLSATQLRIARNPSDVRTFTFAATAFVPLFYLHDAVLELVESDPALFA